MSVATEKASFTVSFGSTGKPPKRLPEGTNLSECLDISDSPLLFGCRTGICGTCLSKVVVVSGELAPPTEDERETVLSVSSGEPGLRLACQLRLTADVDIVPAERT